jgi:hypothetical protein
MPRKAVAVIPSEQEPLQARIDELEAKLVLLSDKELALIDTRGHVDGHGACGDRDYQLSRLQVAR